MENEIKQSDIDEVLKKLEFANNTIQELRNEKQISEEKTRELQAKIYSFDREEREAKAENDQLRKIILNLSESMANKK